ncbi:MAG: hypothetical protein LBC61_07440, partial [Candidatus Peribacteria bacterium]|nr:hypothetical protein [Candidatus Peribacteria bacterium]
MASFTAFLTSSCNFCNSSGLLIFEISACVGSSIDGMPCLLKNAHSIHFLVSSFPSIITPQIASGKFVSVGKTFMSSGIQSKTKV